MVTFVLFFVVLSGEDNRHMRLLITGANGLLGQKLVALIAPRPDIELIATSRGDSKIHYDFLTYRYRPMDVTRPAEVDEVIEQEQPDVIIHTAALTKVDYCEHHRELCYRLNVKAVDHVVRAAVKHNCFLIHLSTDFVFSGDKRLLTEEDLPNPVNYYGQTKLEAEQRITESGVKHAIVRTAIVYGVVPHLSRSNIILWVKESLKRGKTIHVVDDQFRTPTLAEDLAEGCFLVAQKRAEGIFNVSGEELLTPYQMAHLTADYFNLDKALIVRTDSTKFKQPARRPLETGFVIEKAKQVLGYQPHTFLQGVRLMHQQLKEINTLA